MTPDDSVPIGPWNNGLLASSYVALTDVAAALAPRVLTALERSRIAAYLSSSEAEGMLRLHVASGERADARTIVAAVVRAAGADPVAMDGGDGADGGDGRDGANDAADAAPPRPDPLAGIDADAEFAALIADWHVDTHTAIRDAEKDLTREDENWRSRLNEQAQAPASDDDDQLSWLDDDHYVPPNPPPIPRPTAPFVLGMLLIAVSILVLAFGAELGLVFEIRLFLAVVGILSATGVFIVRLRAYRDDDDDGAVL